MTVTPRTTEYRYNADGKLVELTVRNEATGEEVTRWEYGVTKADGEIASNELLRAKIYPDSDDGRDDDGWDGVYDRVEYRYNVAGELIRQKDQNGTVHEYGYDKLGRLVADRVTELGDGIDDAVLAIGRSYNVKGQLEKVTTYEDAELEEVRDQLQFAYDGFGQVTKDYQEHEGPVNVNSSQRVSYVYESGGEESNTARLVQIGYSKLVDYNYGIAGSIDDLAERVRTIESGGVGVARYTKRGVNATVRVEYLDPGVELTYIKEEGEPVGDAGDQYTGLDRFNRIEDIRWINRFGETPYDVDRYQYGFDRAGNRVWRRNVVQAGQGFDESYGYDALYQLTDLERGNLNINRTAVGATPAWEEVFNYDQAGNWQRYVTKVGGIANLIQRRQHNRANEITFIDGTNLQAGHDRAGNMTRMPKVGDWETAQTNTWDAWNRLVRVAEGETMVGEYAYDGLTRRIWKKATIGDTTYTRHGYFSSQWQLLEERYSPEDEAPDRTFVWGMRYVDDLVLRECLNYDPIRIYATHDQWHVTALLASDGGAAVERYCYSAFGSPTVMDADWIEREESVYDWETRYGAYRWDQETGLYCVRYRYLHSNLGRWLSRDPIDDFWWFFVYVGNRPTQEVDPSGLAPQIVIQNIRKPEAGLCGGFVWTINWGVSDDQGQVRPYRGYIHQTVRRLSRSWHCQDGCKQEPQLANRGEWSVITEAWYWPLREGRRAGDTWIKGAELGCCGEASIEAEAVFVTELGVGYTPIGPRPRPDADEIFRADIAGPSANLLNNQNPPKPPKGVGRSCKRRLSVKWDCCGKQRKTQLVEAKPECL